MNDELDTHARAAYDAHADRRRGYRKPPPWDLALDHDKDAWRAVVRALKHSLYVHSGEEAKVLPFVIHSATGCPEGVRDCNCDKQRAFAK